MDRSHQKELVFHQQKYFDLILIVQEVLVRFSGFGPEEDEWVNVRKHVRQRSLPCESSECVAVLPGDLILCFQVQTCFHRCPQESTFRILIIY